MTTGKLLARLAGRRGLTPRGVSNLLADAGIYVDRTTVHRWFNDRRRLRDLPTVYACLDGMKATPLERDEILASVGVRIEGRSEAAP